MQTIITTDSTCDLSKELIEKYNIKVFPLSVITDDEHLDGVDLLPDDIFNYVSRTKTLPKTAARSALDFEDFFEQYTKEGNSIVHIGIGSKLSASFSNACEAAKNIGIDKVFIVDGNTLSTGTGLLLIYASELAQLNYNASQIAEMVKQRTPYVQASFVVDTLEYLYRGGRCSALSMFGANLLKIKPRLQLIDGKIAVTGKYRGKMRQVLEKYIDDSLVEFNNPDKKRCFITHATADKEIVDDIVAYVKEKNIFEEIIVTCAGSTITSHCGKGTLGILYINDGGKK